MKKNKSTGTKFLCVLAAWVIVGIFFMTVPAFNISCGTKTPFSSPPPEADEGGTDFNIHLNGGDSAAGEGGPAGVVNIISGGAGTIDIGGATPAGLPAIPDTSGAPGPNTAGACVLQGTLTVAQIEAMGPPCDNDGVSGIITPSAEVVIDGTISDTVPINIDFNFVGIPDLDLNVTKRGKIIAPSIPINMFVTGNVYLQGLVDTSGADSGTAAGGFGGPVTILTNDALSTGGSGSIIVTGIIDTSGGNHTGTGVGGFPGGIGAPVTIRSDDNGGVAPNPNIAISGTINTSGGSSLDTAAGATGGIGGQITILGQTDPGDLVSIFVTGNLLLNGGSSVGDVGGIGAPVTITPENAAVGNLTYLTGNITSNGGSGSGLGGSNAGVITIASQSGDIVIASDIDLNGGDTFGATTSGNGSGGFISLTTGTGNITLVGDDGNIQANGGTGFNCTTPLVDCRGGVLTFDSNTGAMSINGTIEANGGSETGGATLGGSGGVLTFVSKEALTNNSNLYANGGSGATTGGVGGVATIVTDTGNLTNTAPISLRGGSGVLTGGEGGVLTMATDPCSSNTGGALTNSATLDVSGGTGGTLGGVSGFMVFRAARAVALAGDITNRGNLIAQGGDSSSGTGGSGDATLNITYPPPVCSTGGGLARTICFNSDDNGTGVASGIIVNGARITANGGSGPVGDGVGGGIEITASDALPPAGNGTVSVTDSKVRATGSAPGSITLTEGPGIPTTTGSTFNPDPVLN